MNEIAYTARFAIIFGYMVVLSKYWGKFLKRKKMTSFKVDFREAK